MPHTGTIIKLQGQKTTQNRTEDMKMIATKEQERKAKEREERFNSLKKEVFGWTRDQLENYVVNTMLEDYDDDYDEDDDFIEEYHC